MKKEKTEVSIKNSITRQIPKHHDNFDVDFNARHLTNRKSIMVKKFMEERDLSCLNISS